MAIENLEKHLILALLISFFGYNIYPAKRKYSSSSSSSSSLFAILKYQT